MRLKPIIFLATLLLAPGAFGNGPIVEAFNEGCRGDFFITSGEGISVRNDCAVWLGDNEGLPEHAQALVILADAAYEHALSADSPATWLTYADSRLAEALEAPAISAEDRELALYRKAWCRYRLAETASRSLATALAHLSEAQTCLEAEPVQETHRLEYLFLRAEAALRRGQLTWLKQNAWTGDWTESAKTTVRLLLQDAVQGFDRIPADAFGGLVGTRRWESRLWSARFAMLLGRDDEAWSLLGQLDGLGVEGVSAVPFAFERKRMMSLLPQNENLALRDRALAEYGQAGGADHGFHEAMADLIKTADQGMLKPSSDLSLASVPMSTYWLAHLQRRFGRSVTTAEGADYRPARLFGRYVEADVPLLERPLQREAEVARCEVDLRFALSRSDADEQRTAMRSIHERLREIDAVADPALQKRIDQIYLVTWNLRGVGRPTEFGVRTDVIVPLLQLAAVSDPNSGLDLMKQVIGDHEQLDEELKRGEGSRLGGPVADLEDKDQKHFFGAVAWACIAMKQVASADKLRSYGYALAEAELVGAGSRLGPEARYLKAFLMNRMILKGSDAYETEDVVSEYADLFAQTRNVRALYRLHDLIGGDAAVTYSKAVNLWMREHDGPEYFTIRTIRSSSTPPAFDFGGASVRVDGMTIGEFTIGQHRELYFERIADPDYLDTVALEEALSDLNEYYPLPPTTRPGCRSVGRSFLPLPVVADLSACLTELRGDLSSALRMKVIAGPLTTVTFDGDVVALGNDGSYVRDAIVLGSPHDVVIRSDGFDDLALRGYEFDQAPAQTDLFYVYLARSLEFDESDRALPLDYCGARIGNRMAVKNDDPLPADLISGLGRRECRDYVPLGGGRYLLTDAAGGAVRTLDPSGTIETWTGAEDGTGLISPEGIARDAEGTVYVVDSATHRIAVFPRNGASGTLGRDWDGTPQRPGDPIKLKHPTRVAVMEAPEPHVHGGRDYRPPVRLLVLDWYGLHLVDENGCFLKTLAGSESGVLQRGEAAPVVVSGYGTGALIGLGSQTSDDVVVFEAR